jgi:UPF0755 protein
MAKSRPGRNYVGGVLSFALILLLSATAAGVGGLMAFSYVSNARAQLEEAKEMAKDPPDLHIPEEDKVYFTVASGSSTKKIAEDLKKAGLIEYDQLFRILSKVNGYDGLYRAGTHLFAKGLGYEELMIALILPPESISLTFPEGLNSRQVYTRFSNSSLAHGGGVQRYIETHRFDYPFLAGLPARDDPLEGYLFPDTYNFDLNAGEYEITTIILDNFEKRITQEDYDRAAALGMTMDQVVTLASIIEREAKEEEDRYLISGVFHNRLSSGDASMRKIQSCATIQYIFYQRNGIMLRTISDSDTRVVDPYNTYLHEGLPPGPICNPGLSSIQAALYPDETEYMFFVARGDGTHQFSKTYDEHLAAIQEYGLNLMP